MNFSALQSLNTPSYGSRLAKTHVDLKTGVQYNLLSEADSQQFHVLDEEGLRQEHEDIEQARGLLLSLRDESRKKKEKHAIKTVTGGKMKKNEDAKFQEALATKQYIAGVDAQLLKEIMSNDQELQDDTLENESELEFAKNATHPGSWSHMQPSGLGVVHESGRVEYGMHVVKERFHENVEIIELLFKEREALRERVEQLESDLVDPERASWIVRANKYGLPITTSHHTHQKHPHSRKTGQQDEAIDGLRAGGSGPPRSAKSHTTSSKAKAAAHGVKTFSAHDFANKLDAPPPPPSKAVSASLLADIDRYIQKRRYIEEDEDMAAALQAREDQEYEDRRRKQLLSYRHTTNHLQGVNERSKEFIKAREEHLKLQRQLQDEELRYCREAASRQLQDHIKKGTVEQELTYDAQLTQEASARRERIERRKTQLLMSSKAPIDYDPQKRRYEEPVPKNMFIAPDPKEVLERLEMRALQWQVQLEQVKEKQREREAEAREIYGSEGVDPTRGMITRQKASEERRNARLARAESAAEERETKRLAVHKREIASMVNSAPPVSGRRLTTAAEKRASIIRERIEAEKKREEEHVRKCAGQSRDNKKMLSTLRQGVAANEASRKATHGNFVEHGGDKAAEKRDATARESAERSCANQRRIQESLRKRPSLFDRHKQEQERLAAVDRALGIVKDAVSSSAASKENYKCSHLNNRRYASDSKGDSDSKDGSYSPCNGDDFDAKVLQRNPKHLAEEISNEILDGKDKWMLGMRDIEAL